VEKGGRGGGRLPPEEGPLEGRVLKGGSGGGRSMIQGANSELDVGVWGGRLRARGEADGVMGREGWGSQRPVGLLEASLLRTLFLGTIAGGREVLSRVEFRLGRQVLKKGARLKVGVVILRGGSGGGGGEDSRGGKGGRSPRVLPGRGFGGRGGGLVFIVGGREVLPKGIMTGILSGSSLTSSLGELV